MARLEKSKANRPSIEEHYSKKSRVNNLKKRDLPEQPVYYIHYAFTPSPLLFFFCPQVNIPVICSSIERITRLDLSLPFNSTVKDLRGCLTSYNDPIMIHRESMLRMTQLLKPIRCSPDLPIIVCERSVCSTLYFF